MKINKKISLSIGALFMTGAAAASTVSCLTVTVSDEPSMKLAREEQERVNNITEIKKQSNTHLVFDSSALVNGSRMSDANVDKVLAAVGVTKNEDEKFGYNVYPFDIIRPTSTTRGSFMASIRVNYDGLENESDLGIGNTKRVKIFLSNTDSLVIQNNMEQARENILNGANGTTNVALTSSKTFAQVVELEGLPNISTETSPKAFSLTTINNFGIELSNNKPSLLNTMGTTITYTFTSGATPAPLLKLFIKNGTQAAPTAEVILYNITFRTVVTP